MIETLRPNAPGDQCNLGEYETCIACPNHYTCVDEEIADGDTTRVSCPSNENNYTLDLYNIADPAVSGTINHIRVYTICKSNKSDPNWESLKISIKATNVHYGTERFLTTSYVSYSEQWNTNPDTGLAWTWDEIASLQIGMAMRAPKISLGRSCCTQIYVEVDYTPPPAGRSFGYISG